MERHGQPNLDATVAGLCRKTKVGYGVQEIDAESRLMRVREKPQMEFLTRMRLYAEIAEGGRKLLEGRFSMQAQGHSIHAFVGRSPKPDAPRLGDAQMRNVAVRLETAP